MLTFSIPIDLEDYGDLNVSHYRSEIHEFGALLLIAREAPRFMREEWGWVGDEWLGWRLGLKIANWRLGEELRVEGWRLGWGGGWRLKIGGWRLKGRVGDGRLGLRLEIGVKGWGSGVWMGS